MIDFDSAFIPHDLKADISVGTSLSADINDHAAIQSCNVLLKKQTSRQNQNFALQEDLIW
jgi:hypothetical protein